jgi:hypothetical protein
MFRTVAAATFAMLAVFAPARAAYVDSVGLYFGANTFAGDVEFQPFDYFGPPGGLASAYLVQSDGVTYNASPITFSPPSNTPGLALIFPPIGSGPTFLTVNTSYLPGLNYSDFAINGTVATAGTVSCVSGCDVSAVPLPAAFPLFGSALAGLGGVGWWKKRGKVSHPTAK